MAEELRPPAPVRGWSWWERPLALLCASAAVLTAFFLLQLLAGGEGHPPRTLADQARAVPAQLR